MYSCRYALAIATLFSLAPVQSLHGQERPPASLQVDPQIGATPRPLNVPQDLPALPPSQPVIQQTVPVPTSMTVSPLGPVPDIPSRQSDITLDANGSALPAPSRTPLSLDRSTDPVLELAEGSGDREAFASAIRTAVEIHPAIDEAEAQRAEVRALRNEARTAELPVIDLSMTYFRVISRDFSNDPQNVLERSRPSQRTDALLQIQQPVLDFGRAKARIASANERLAAAGATVDDYGSQLAMASIAAWYRVFTYRALVRLGEAFVANQNELRGALEKRVRQEVSAPADLAQYDSFRASAQAQLADLERQLDSAEAQYAAAMGKPAPDDLGRAPIARDAGLTDDSLINTVETLPAVIRARRLASAARYETKAYRAAQMPEVSVGVDSGRYGVFENDRDYDIRGRITYTQRFLGGAKQRTDQAKAREDRANAMLERVRVEALRDAQVALSDVQALTKSVEALREDYFSSRQARDTLFERFRYSRGTLFDVLQAQTNFYNVAVRYVSAISELDIARYSLLANTGQLLRELEIESVGSPE